ERDKRCLSVIILGYWPRSAHCALFSGSPCAPRRGRGYRGALSHRSIKHSVVLLGREISQSRHGILSNRDVWCADCHGYGRQPPTMVRDRKSVGQGKRGEV